MGKHKEEEKFWGYLIEADKTPTPLFQALLIGISHYIIKNVAPWDTKTLTPSKMAHFYRLVGGDYDSLFLESPNASIAFIYKSLGCYHSLQPTRDPFAAPSIPALTNDGFVRWQTVQLLLGPEEHVPFLQEAVKRFEIKNPIHGGYFPRVLPAEALPRTPDPEMTRWHDQVGERLLRESGAAGAASITDSRPSLEDQPVTDAGPYVHSPPAGATESQRPSSMGQRPAAHGRPPRPDSMSGLQAPQPNVRRHSVPDRARGEFAPDRPTRVFSTPTTAEPVYPPDGAPTVRHHSNDDAAHYPMGRGRYSSRSPSPSRRRTHQSSSSGSVSPRLDRVPEQAAPPPAQVHFQPPSQSQARPPPSATDPVRQPTAYNVKEYPPPPPQSQQRPPLSTVDASGRVVYPMAPPQYRMSGAPTAMPAGRRGNSPPSRLAHFSPPTSAGSGAPLPPGGANPIRQHPPPPPPPPASGPSPVVAGTQPPPNTPYTRSPPSRHPAASAAVRPSSSASTDSPLPAPNPAPAAAQASMVPPPAAVRFTAAPDAEIRAGSSGGERGGERVRRRTMEEVAREHERAREEMEFEYGRRRQRPLAGSGTAAAARRSRSRGDRPPPEG